MAETKYVSRENLSKILGKIKDTYVQKVDGKGLSTNDFTTELLNKLNGIAAGAQVNVIETVKVNGVAQPVTEKGVDITVPTKVGQLENDSKYLTQVSESNLDNTLKEKVNASAAANHSHANKALLDTYTQTEENLADAVAKKHSHANAAELALIASGDKAKWDAAATDTATIKADYLKQADKYDDTALAGRVKTIEDDYLKQADKYDDTELAGRVSTVEGKVTTLIGDDSNKSVRTIAAEELAAQLIADGAKESLDTLAEIAAWIQSHPDDASAMNEAIVALQKQLQGIDAGEGTVKKYVDDAITALKIGDYAKAADLTALAGRVTTLEGASHTHANAEELAKIASGDKAKWDAVAADYVKASELVAYTDAEIDEIWNAAMA